MLRGLRDPQAIGTLLANAVAAASADDQNTRVERSVSREARQDVGVLSQPVGV
jgi:hypothetical protein